MGAWRKELRLANYQKNKLKRREAAKLYAKLHPEKRKQTLQKTRTRIDAIVYAAKNRACKDCDKWFPACAMHFDHVRGEKVADIAKLRSNKGLPKILAEIDKCEVVCANCHAIRTCIRDLRPKARLCDCKLSGLQQAPEHKALPPAEKAIDITPIPDEDDE